MRKLLNILLEGIDLPIKIGDTVKMGKFKNKKVIVKSIEWNEKGDLLINGRPALKFRLMPETNVFDEGKLEESKQEFVIWGIPPKKSSEEILYTKAKSNSEAKKVVKILTKKHGVKKARIQVLDLEQDPSKFWKSDNIFEGTSKIKKVSGTLPTKITDKYKKLKDIPDGDVGKDFSQHHKYSQTAPMGNIAEPDTYDWDDDDKEQGGYQKEKDKKKKGYEPVTEASKKIKKVIAIYPGRFQPFGPHHKKVYLALKKKFGDVYVVTSNIQKPPRHPMNFKEKVQHITKMGIPPNKIVMDNPYKPINLLKKFKSEETAVVFAVGEKDKSRLSSGQYFDDYNKNKNNLKGYKEHGYVLRAPHISVNVAGKEVSGTTMRQILGSSKIKPEQRKKLFKQLFGYFNDSVYKMMIGNFKNV
jgi:hypothetical protein